MRPIEKSTGSATTHAVRFGDPATWVCAALALAVVVLSMRIVSIW